MTFKEDAHETIGSGSGGQGAMALFKFLDSP